MSNCAAVASLNPVKLNSCRFAFEKVFPQEKFVFKESDVDSGVSDQPFSDEETLKGAQNRAFRLSKSISDADFYIGIEGGLSECGNEIEAFAWAVVLSNDGKLGKGKTGSFFLPKPIVDLLKKGYELGDADDIVFEKSSSKRKNGAVGILTKNLIDRTLYYEHALILSLIPFVNRELYF